MYKIQTIVSNGERSNSLSLSLYIEICENNNNKQLIKLFSFADSENCRIQLHCIKYNRMCVFRLTSSFLRLPIGWRRFRLHCYHQNIHPTTRLNFIQKAAVQNILQYIPPQFPQWKWMQIIQHGEMWIFSWMIDFYSSLKVSLECILFWPVNTNYFSFFFSSWIKDVVGFLLEVDMMS